MNCLTASSVCWLLGLLAISMLWRAVDGLEGGEVGWAEYGVDAGSGFMRSMNLTLPPVRKQWMWLF